MAMKSNKKKFSFRKFFGREKRGSNENEDSLHSNVVECEDKTSFSVPPTPLSIGSFSEGRELGRINFREVSSMLLNNSETQPFKIFVATWNAGGKPPHIGVNLNDFLPVDDLPDMYILGFQEIVPLNAGNVLVTEDSEPAVKWLELINAALNKPLQTEGSAHQYTPKYSKSTPDALGIIPIDKPLQTEGSAHQGTPKYSKSTPDAFGIKPVAGRDAKTNATLFFQKPSLKEFSKRFKIVNARRLKTCNCPSEVQRKYWKETCFICPQSSMTVDDTSEEEEEEPSGSTMTDEVSAITSMNQLNYSLITSKQMVGIFVTIWVKREHVQHIGHLRLSTVNCGILGYLGNKGCISVSLSLHQTSFCFVCSHLASGEKEGDELKRNSDVIEILKSTQFRRICKVPNRRIPEKILDHDQVIWLGDLNYRIALSYTETKRLLDENDWDTLLEKDQLKIEREAGRVFNGWNEGKIYFAPTYKYSDNSDAYAGESVTSKKKRRTPAWCDRILWHGDGIVQLSYIRGESRFSDHRPVCAVFIVEVEVSSSRKDASSRNMKVGAEELLPPDSC